MAKTKTAINPEEAETTFFDIGPIHNRHYIVLDKKHNIIEGFSDGPLFERSTNGAILINEEGDYQFRLKFPDGTLSEENPPLWNMDGIALYKYVNGEIIAKTEEEIQAEIDAIPLPPPSPMEQLRADVDFIAVMAGVDL